MRDVFEGVLLHHLEPPSPDRLRWMFSIIKSMQFPVGKRLAISCQNIVVRENDLSSTVTIGRRVRSPFAFDVVRVTRSHVTHHLFRKFSEGTATRTSPSEAAIGNCLPVPVSEPVANDPKLALGGALRRDLTQFGFNLGAPLPLGVSSLVLVLP